MVFYLCRILEAKQSCELNPSKIESPTEACANAEFLLQVDYFNHLVSRFNVMMVYVQVLDDITESIFMSSEACPRTLRYICACLQRDVQNRCRNIFGFCLNIIAQVAARETCENSGGLRLYIPSPSLSCNSQS